MFERRLYYHIDWAMLVAVLALCAIGLAQIYSATRRVDASIFQTQIYGIVLGLVALLVCLSIDYRSLADKSHLIYIGDPRACSSTCCSSAPCAAARGAGSIWVASTCSRRSSPRRRWRWCSRSSSATAGAAA